MTTVLMVNPDDVNLPSVKARAAELGLSVDANRFVPRGQILMFDRDALGWEADDE